ncbi:MAG TPA: MFS transporter [Verrucomicrobiae bacterium]|jgi:FHS family L-fucose permease-like MFS transporter|nr:MFS transporter [Verrucomicrobiae bacterium]
MPPVTEPTSPTSTNKKGVFTLPDGSSAIFPFFLVAILFALWAVLNSLIDTMDKHFQDLLHLKKAESAWVQTAHYFGYTLMALPAGFLTRKIGYKGGIIFGLLLVSLGGFWFVPATHISEFWAFLLGVCVVAMGLTVLETVANPYTTVLGPKEYGTFRINLAQSFNGAGWIAGPYIASYFFYATTGGAEAANKTLYIPYLIIAILVLVLVVLFWRAKLPEIQTEDDYHTDEAGKTVTTEKTTNKGLSFLLMLVGASVIVFSVYAIVHFVMEKAVSGWWFFVPVVVVAVFLWLYSQRLSSYNIWAHPHFSAAAIAQFFYVAAQAGIFSFFINYMIADLPAISEAFRNNGLVHSYIGDGITQMADGNWHLNDRGASRMQTIAFFLFFIGRVIGSALLRKTSAHRALGTYAIINLALCGVVIMKAGWISALAVFGTFFFMSIMFPTIFALGIFGLGPDSKKKASAFIVMSITGGALMPKLMGRLGDLYGMSASFLMPLVCFIFIAAYGFCWPKLSQSEGVVGMKASGGH